MSTSSWSVVSVHVQPGPLGLIVSKSNAGGSSGGAVVVDGFRPVGDNGEKGTLEQHGGIVQGSVLLGVNEHDFTDPSLAFDKIRDVLIETASLEREVRFKVPPAGAAEALRTAGSKHFHEEYTFGRELGSGTFSVVREATNRKTGVVYAIKCIKRAELTDEDLDALMLEVDILKQMEHPHIMKLYDVYLEDEYYYLVTEHMPGGELFDRIVEKNFYTEREARDLVKVLLESIKYCHDKQVVHRDLKPENLLLSSKSDDADIKLADFGFAKKVAMDGEGLVTACGTPGYVAPEILQAKPYGTAVDIWSIGVITYILLCGYPPFHHDNQSMLFRLIKSGKFVFDSPYWDDVSAEAKDLISRMLVVDPSKRATADELLAHQWITGSDISNVHLTGTIEQLRRFNARRKFKAAVSTVKATISLTKKLTLGGSSHLSSTGSSNSTTTTEETPASAVVAPPLSTEEATAATAPPAAPSTLA